MGVLVGDAAEGDEVIKKYDADNSGTIDAAELAGIVRDLEALKTKYTTQEKLQIRKSMSMSRMPAPGEA